MLVKAFWSWAGLFQPLHPRARVKKPWKKAIQVTRSGQMIAMIAVFMRNCDFINYAMHSATSSWKRVLHACEGILVLGRGISASAPKSSCEKSKGKNLYK